MSEGHLFVIGLAVEIAGFAFMIGVLIFAVRLAPERAKIYALLISACAVLLLDCLALAFRCFARWPPGYVLDCLPLFALLAWAALEWRRLEREMAVRRTSVRPSVE